MMINKIHPPRQLPPPNYDKQNCQTMSPSPSRPCHHHHHHHHQLGKFPPSSICLRDFYGLSSFAQIQILHFYKNLGTPDQSHSHCHSVSWPKPILALSKNSPVYSGAPPTVGAAKPVSLLSGSPNGVSPRSPIPQVLYSEPLLHPPAQAQPVTPMVSAPEAGHRQVSRGTWIPHR